MFDRNLLNKKTTIFHPSFDLTITRITISITENIIYDPGSIFDQNVDLLTKHFDF